MSDESYRSAPVSQHVRRDTPEVTFEDFHAHEYVVDTVTPYGAHRHPEHQLAWMREGTMQLRIGTARWHLHRQHVVWIPGNVLHEMTLLTAGRLVTAYAQPDFRPDGRRWSHPHVFEVDELAANLLLHMRDEDLGSRRRSRCVELLFDLLDSAPERHDVLALPRKGIAGHIADHIVADPSDARSLEDWARELGVSTKTVMRAFVADTGSTYGQWRTRARMYASLAMLSAGTTVSDTAGDVGYRTTSGFIAAFRDEFGITPGRYTERASLTQD
ncbi:helix-turn-helix domain-containing protein [Rhodococcoides yunnanense]|uniref:helix-turn-helix domain-containing protein n=1 Tax=Rhodococcoides yunnanense TaxID=278209 RepID=UPI000933B96E|nr:AraC family transcriptional regulator [Rhodococcus yunnanensis]